MGLITASLVGARAPSIIVPPAYLAGSDTSLLNLLDLWRNGEAGTYQDPFDLPYAYQESTGVTAAAVNSPVGLALDKKLGLVRGAELVANGTFDVNTNSWIATTCTAAVVGGELELTATASTFAFAQQITTLVVGKSYLFTAQMYRKQASGSVRLTTVSVADGEPITSATAVQTQMVVRATATTHEFRVGGFSATVGDKFGFDNISVREIPGIHLSQATAGSRPALKLDGGIYSWLFDGTDDGLASATFAAGTLTSNMDCFIAVKRSVSESGTSVLCSMDAGYSKFFAVYANGGGTAASTNAGSPTFAVNGSAVPGGTGTTRGQLFSAMPSPGSWGILEIRSLDLSAWTALRFFGDGLPLNGNISGIVLCPAQTDSRRAQIRRVLGRKVGLSL